MQRLDEGEVSASERAGSLKRARDHVSCDAMFQHLFRYFTFGNDDCEKERGHNSRWRSVLKIAPSLEIGH